MENIQLKRLLICIGRIFLFSTIIFGLFTLPVSLCASGFVFGELLRHENEYVTQYGWILFIFIPIIFAISYGLPMSLILGIVHYYHVKKIAKNGIVDLSVKQSREIIIPSAGVLEKCREAIIEIGARIIEDKSNNRQIFAKTDASWKSWSEDIRIQIINVTNNESKIIINSQPSLKTVMVDYGKDIENVEKLVDIINVK